MSVRERCHRGCSEVCSVKTVKQKLPITSWLPKYRFSDLQCDIIAGLTVGLTVIPQGLAYASLAQLPPQYGLYSAFVGCFIYCILGTSKDITLGPTAIMSLMTATFAKSPIPYDSTYAVVLTLFCGAVQLLLGVLHLGIIVEFISFPVISGFTSAAAIIIATGQIKHFLGLPKPPANNIPPGFIQTMYDLFTTIKSTNPWDLLLGACSLVILFLLKLLKSKDWGDDGQSIPLSQRAARKFLWLMGTGRNAVVVLSAALFTAALLSQNIEVLSLTSNVKEGLPPISVPKFSVSQGNHTYTASDIFSHIGVGFAVVPLIGLVETIAIGKAFARQNGYRIEPSQELIAIGVSNVLGSFVSSYPVTGSFSRTAVNSQSGVRTPASGIFTGGLVLLALGVLTPLFRYIPSAALAAVIISAVLPMCEFKVILHFWKVKKLDIIPWAFTFISSFLVGIEYGILIGIGVSTLIILYPLARPSIQTRNKDYLLMSLSQGLQYPGIDYVKQQIIAKVQEEDYVKPVVLDGCHVSTADYSTAQGMKELAEDLRKMGSLLVFCQIQPGVAEVLRHADIPDLTIVQSVADAEEHIKEQYGSDEVNARQSLLDPGNQSSQKSIQQPEDQHSVIA